MIKFYLFILALAAVYFCGYQSGALDAHAVHNGRCVERLGPDQSAYDSDGNLAGYKKRGPNAGHKREGINVEIPDTNKKP